MSKMGRPTRLRKEKEEKLVQMNILVPESLKDALKRVSRIRAVEKDEEVVLGDVVREALIELALLSGSYKLPE